MADDWLGISSDELDSYCGYTYTYTLEKALDGTGEWYHGVAGVHWFVLDLGETYTIKKVKGRCDAEMYQPTDVNIYIDDNNPPTTLCEEGISTFKDTRDWVEITLTTPGTGRYLKVEIEGTEYGSPGPLDWGAYPDYFTIFDAYGDIAAAPHVPRPTVAVGNPLMF